jgi:hypothetical protein
VSAAEAEANIIANYGPVSVEQRIGMAEELAQEAAQLYSSALAQCPEIKRKLPHDPQLN